MPVGGLTAILRYLSGFGSIRVNEQNTTETTHKEN